jgi:hypothetical protein
MGKFISRINPQASQRTLHPHVGVIPSAAVLQAERGISRSYCAAKFPRMLEFAAEEIRG